MSQMTVRHVTMTAMSFIANFGKIIRSIIELPLMCTIVLDSGPLIRQTQTSLFFNPYQERLTILFLNYDENAHRPNSYDRQMISGSALMEGGNHDRAKDADGDPCGGPCLGRSHLLCDC